MTQTLPKTVLWDMDGTLIDQTGPIIQCYTEVITAMGYPSPESQEIRRSMGGPMKETMSLFVNNERLEEACLSFRERFPEIMFQGLVTLPGALESIEFFASRGIPQAIFTNKHGETARAVSEHCGFSRHISVCIGNTDTGWSKPAAELTNHVLSQISAGSEGAILIGDSPTDGETARNAKIGFYAVSTGAHSIDELNAAGAEATFPDLTKLLAHFQD